MSVFAITIRRDQVIVYVGIYLQGDPKTGTLFCTP